MIQPTLLSPAANSKTSGNVDKSPKSDELLAQEGELTEKFSDLYNSAVKDPKNIKGKVVKGELAEAGKLSDKLAEAGKLSGKLAEAGKLSGKLAGAGKQSGKLAEAEKLSGKLVEAGKSSGKLAETGKPSGELAEAGKPSGELAEAGKPSDKLSSDDLSDETDATTVSEELSSSIAQPMQNLEEKTNDGSLSLEHPDFTQNGPEPAMFSGLVAGENRAIIKTETQQEPPVSPILAQIQAAQKMDVQVTDVQKMTPLDETATSVKALGVAHGGQLSAVPGDDKSIKAGKGEKVVINGESKNIFGESLKNAQGDAAETVKNKPLKFDLSQQAADKPGEVLFANHSEIDKTVLTHSFDAGALRATDVSASGASKLVSQNIHNAAQPSAQQESLDIQSKHASTLLGERVLMMINQGKQEVQIRLDPAELGSMHLKLHMHQNQVHLAIQTDVSQSKDIIEQNLPRLREQLAQQGVSLGETSVGQHAQGQQNPNQQSESAAAQRSASTAIADDSLLANMGNNMTLASLKIPISKQGIDSYA